MHKLGLVFCGLVIAGCASSSGSGPGAGLPACDALHSCCDDIADPTANQQCHDQATQLSGAHNAAEACASAMQGYTQAGMCGGGSTGGSGGGGASCDELGACCTKGEATFAEQCQAALEAYKKSSDPETGCKSALMAYEQSKLCGPAGSGGAGGTGGATGGTGGATGGTGGAMGGTGGTTAATEDTNALCSDGKDNDGDGYVDCKDFSCTKGPSVTVCKGTPGPETNDAMCSDGKDNDGDGYVDCIDYDCQNSPQVTVCP